MPDLPKPEIKRRSTLGPQMSDKEDFAKMIENIIDLDEPKARKSKTVTIGPTVSRKSVDSNKPEEKKPETIEGVLKLRPNLL
jgi:hypothetical protein